MGSSRRQRALPSFKYVDCESTFIAENQAKTEGEFQSRRIVRSIIRRPNSIMDRRIVLKSIFNSRAFAYQQTQLVGQINDVG